MNVDVVVDDKDECVALNAIADDKDDCVALDIVANDKVDNAKDSHTNLYLTCDFIDIPPFCLHLYTMLAHVVSKPHFGLHGNNTTQTIMVTKTLVWGRHSCF